MARRYHTLVIREDGRWAPQFGDYSKADVQQEERDCYTHFQGKRIPKTDRKIITTDDTQAAITAAIDALNGAAQ